MGVFSRKKVTEDVPVEETRQEEAVSSLKVIRRITILMLSTNIAN